MVRLIISTSRWSACSSCPLCCGVVVDDGQMRILAKNACRRRCTKC
jgi:hypothetical protein